MPCQNCWTFLCSPIPSIFTWFVFLQTTCLTTTKQQRSVIFPVMKEMHKLPSCVAAIKTSCLTADELLPHDLVFNSVSLSRSLSLSHLSLLPTIHRGDWYWQVNINEHALQHHVWERRGEPLSEWRVSAAANVRPARKQRPPQTDDCWHCWLRWSDQQRGQVRMVKWWSMIFRLTLMCRSKHVYIFWLKLVSTRLKYNYNNVKIQHN